MVCRTFGALLLVMVPLAAWGEEPPETEPLATLGELREEVDVALRAEATSSRQGENPQEVLQLIDVYRKLAADPRRDESPTVQKLGLRVKARLTLVKRKISKVKAPPHTTLAQQLAPGGGGQGGAVGGGGTQAGAVDYGPELVALIQEVISPEVWDINGGPASIAYYRPGRALVVRAPGEVHAQVGQTVRDLRAAGGP